MDRLRELLAGIMRGFGRFTAGQKISMALIAGTVLVSLIMLALLTRTAEYIPLVSGLTAEEQIHVQTVLQGADIPYRAVGNSFRVRTADHVRAIAELARQPGGMAFSQINLLGMDEDERGFSPQTREQRRERLWKEKELKLGMVISKFEEITGATVFLDVPEDSVFLTSEKAGTASVLVSTRGGAELTRGTAMAVKQLVAGVSRRLKPQNVTLTDKMGMLYDTMGDSAAAIASHNLAVQREREKDLANKILTNLTAVFGARNVRAIVHLDLNWDKQTTEKTEYDDPRKAVQVSSKTVTEKSTDEAPGGVPGDRSNTGASVAGASTSGSTRNLKEEEGEFVIGSTKTNTVKDSPEVVGVAAQVMLDKTRLDQVAQDAGKSADEILAEWKQAIAGLIQAKLENVSVQALPFEEPVGPPPQPLADVVFAYLSRYGTRAVLVLIALVALVVLRSIVKKAVPRPQIMVEEKPEAEVEAELEAEVAPPPDAETVRAEKVRQKVMEMVQENPAGASMILRRWVSKG